VKGNKLIKVLQGLVMTTAFVFLFSCSGQNDRQVTLAEDASEDVSYQSDISFDTLSHDFGTIIEGEMVVCYFDYKNIGEGDLLIKSVTATCGCTTPDWNKAPLKSGESDRLKVVFNSSGRSGSQLKTVSVESNALTPLVKLSIRANVIKRK